MPDQIQKCGIKMIPVLIHCKLCRFAVPHIEPLKGKSCLSQVVFYERTFYNSPVDFPRVSEPELLTCLTVLMNTLGNLSHVVIYRLQVCISKFNDHIKTCSFFRPWQL